MILTSSAQGLISRSSRILDKKSSATVMIGLDGGPQVDETVRQAVMGGAGALVGFRALFKGMFDRGVEPMRTASLIMKVASSPLRQNSMADLMAYDIVTHALAGDLQGIAVPFSIASRYETNMLRNFGLLASTCLEAGMPCMARIYPGSKEGDGTSNYYLRFHAP